MGEGLVGSRKCTKNHCQVCKNVIEIETFQSFIDKKVYKIIDLHVVTSVWSCNVCGVQCNCQTNDEFRYRRNDCKDNNRKSLRGEDHKQAALFAHFQTAGQSGFINDTEIRFIDKTDASNHTRREDF